MRDERHSAPADARCSTCLVATAPVLELLRPGARSRGLRAYAADATGPAEWRFCCSSPASVRRLSSATLACTRGRRSAPLLRKMTVRNARVHEKHKCSSGVRVAGGGITRWVPHGGLVRCTSRRPDASLYDIEVLTLVARGLIDRTIGRQLSISEATVKTAWCACSP